MKLLQSSGFITLWMLFGGLQAPTATAQLSPEQELATFKAELPLHVELVAAEPLVESPCAMAFDERGRLFVAENRGYPRTSDPPQGRIVMLEDTHGNGRMDKRTVFADGLTFPNGVMPWMGGLIVTCAPDILYLKDTHGDGRADSRTVLLTGFDASKSTQLRVNCPTLGPDGWIYFAAGLVGGTITSPEHPEKPPLKMTGDLRWDPRTGDFENVDGRSQYGMSFDDFGRRFICMNRLPVQHVVMQSRWLRRNPHLAFSDTVQDCNERSVKTGLRGGGDGVRVFPISHNITTADSHAGSFTAACGVMIWRGGALPEHFNGCALSCEPTGNLVHADRLKPEGATFHAEALLKEREFLASSDDWCRPVFLTSGPDGALYVCDMYRKIIEHPDYLPEEIRKHSDFEAGKAKGRIWRITTKERKWEPEKWPRVREGESEWAKDAAATIANENGWWRQMAFRKFVEVFVSDPTGQTRNSQMAREALDKIFPGMTNAAARTVLYRLYDFSEIDSEMLNIVLRDSANGVREVGLLRDENLLSASGEAFEFSHNKEIFRCTESDDARLRFVTAISLGMRDPKIPIEKTDERTIPSFATIASRGGADRWTRAAVLSGIAEREREFASKLFEKLKDETPGAFDLLGALGVIFGRVAIAEKRDVFSNESMPNIENTPTNLRLAFLAGVADGASVRVGDSAPAWIHAAISDAAKVAQQHAASIESRTRAVGLLKHADWKIAGPALSTVVTSDAAFDLRTNAIRALVTFDDTEAATALLSQKRWGAITPAEREVTLSALLGRPAHIPRVLEAIESGTLPRNALSAAQRNALSKSKDPAIRERAAKLLGAPADDDRMKAYEASKAVLALAPTAAHGREVFKNICASCHRLDREGYQVGPDLLDIRSQPKESILLHIVVPDFEIAPGFAASNLELKDGRSLAGIIVSETPESVTLRQPLGVEENILRSNITALSASDHSMMPPGLESAMSRQDLADLLSFLKGEN